MNNDENSERKYSDPKSSGRDNVWHVSSSTDAIFYAERAAIEELFLEGVEHFDEQQYEQAIILFERALALAQKINDSGKQADLLTNIAGAYYCMEPFGTVYVLITNQALRTKDRIDREVHILSELICNV